MRNDINTKLRNFSLSLRKVQRIPLYLVATVALIVPFRQALSQNSFEKFNETIVQKICSGRTDWLRCYKQDPLRCRAIAARIVDKCVTSEVTLQIVPGRTADDIPAMADNLDSCIRNTFKAELGPKRQDSRECENVRF